MEVTVPKTELRKIIAKNRDKHRAMFEKAVEVYRKKLIAWHEEEVKRLLKGDTDHRMWRGPVPEDHTDDYDTVLMMLDMEVGETLTLQQHEFHNYVRDQWGWSGSFAANTASYLAK